MAHICCSASSQDLGRRLRSTRRVHGTDFEGPACQVSFSPLGPNRHWQVSILRHATRALSQPLSASRSQLTALVIAHRVSSRHAHPSSLPCSWYISKLLACPRMPVAAFHNSIHSNIQTDWLPPARKGVIAAGQVMNTTVPSIMQHQSLPYGALGACGWSGAHQRIQLDDRAFQKFILMLRARALLGS